MYIFIYFAVNFLTVGLCSSKYASNSLSNKLAKYVI